MQHPSDDRNPADEPEVGAGCDGDETQVVAGQPAEEPEIPPQRKRFMNLVKDSMEKNDRLGRLLA